MASPRVSSVPPRLSFAKVAAMRAPNPVPTSQNLADEKSPAQKEGSNRRTTVVRDAPQLSASALPAEAIITSEQSNTNRQSIAANGTAGAIEGLSLVGPPAGINGVNSAESGDSLEDDQSHLSTSSTKQHSFETKSMASVTTFGLDEKESIRPDDSASVRAVDDEEGGSTLGRNPAFQSEPDVIMPALRGPLARLGGGSVTTGSRRFHILTNPPRFGDLEANPNPEAASNECPLSNSTADRHDETAIRAPAVPVAPDDKLLDALASPKDRLSILQLEERLVAFINHPTVEYFDLPPQNSYARLLAHKLADYYGLLHHINEDGASIRIFRANSMNLPTSLALLAKSIPVGSVQSLGPSAVQIMRRAGIGSRQMSAADSTAASSSVPSKATSEAGHSEEGITSPIEGTPSRDKSKLTREEREAQYKAARERIFGDFQELSISESVSTGENSASLSRSSSSSGKKKNRRQKTPKDDSFEARSAFVPSYAPIHGMSMQPSYQTAQYIDPSFQPHYDVSPGPFGNQMNYASTPTQAYPGFDHAMQVASMSGAPDGSQGFAMQEHWTGLQQESQGGYYNYPQGQMPRSSYPSMNPMMPPMSSQFPQHQSWANNQFQPAFRSPTTPAGSSANWSNQQMYPYGQTSNQPYANNNPVPAQASMANSFNRSLFNPQTRSFVPNTTGSGSSAGSRNGNRKKPSHSLHSSQQHNRSGNTAKAFAPNGLPNALAATLRVPEALQSSLSGTSEESLQKKYGTPANLPKKPPPSQVSSQFDVPSLSAVRNPNAVAAGLVANGRAGGGESQLAPSAP